MVMVMGLLVAAVAAAIGAEPAPPPLFELQTTAMCGANGTSHITSTTECGWAAQYLDLNYINNGVTTYTDTGRTFGCIINGQGQIDYWLGLGADQATLSGISVTGFNSVGLKDGTGSDNSSVFSICRTAEGAAAAAATDYALGLHNTTTTCETGGRAVTTYTECLHAAVAIRGLEIRPMTGLNNFKTIHFDSHGQPGGGVGGVCYHSFDNNEADGSYRYTDGKFHFNTNTTVPTELMSTVCAVPKKEELCAADGEFVEGTMGDAACPDGTVTIDTPEECMLAAKTTLKLIPYNSPMNGSVGIRAMSTIGDYLPPAYLTPPNCSYWKDRAQDTNLANYAVINFNSKFDTGNTVSPDFAPLCRCEAPPPPPTGPPPLFELQSTATCGANETSHITSPTECGYAAAQLFKVSFSRVNIRPNAPLATKGCTFSQFYMININLNSAFQFNAIGNTNGNGTDAESIVKFKSICRTAEGAAAAAATEYALGLHNTTTTCATTGRAVTTYHECIHAAVTIRGVEITSYDSFDDFNAEHFDYHSQPTDSVGVCYHSFDNNDADGSYRYTDGKFHFNTNTTVPTELMSTVCAVPKKEELCAADGDFVKGTMGNATCPDGTVTIDTPEECMLAAKTALKLIPYGSPMNGTTGGAMRTESHMMRTESHTGDSTTTNYQLLPNCSYRQTRAVVSNPYNYGVLNFNSKYDDDGDDMILDSAPLCRCEAPAPPGPAGPAGQVISTTAAGGTTTAKPKDSKPSTLMIVIIVIVAGIAVGGITFLIYINPEKFKSTDADMNAQML